MVAGSEKEQFRTMISTGEYYDVIDLIYSSYSIETLYEMGVVLDLTDLIEQYMPNYVAFVNSNEELKMQAYTIIDGEKKMLKIVGGGNDVTKTFEGYGYRRDWLVKYGVNPKTGEPFTGGYSAKTSDGKNDPNSWSDNVMFPSWYDETNKYAVEYKANHPEWDGSNPIFISDWEWMFGIFEKAFEDLGITDSYCMSIYYVGYMETGDMWSSFGGGSPLWSKKDGKLSFNALTDSMKSYLECMNNWYEKGWLDKRFNERSSDMFYSINQSAFRQGKVPVICAGLGNVGNNIEDSEYPLTDGIMLYPTKLPINDLYGTEETKGKEPDALYQGTYATGSVAVTSNAKDKDLATLLTFIDYLYTEEGCKIAAMGLNKEQYEEIKDSLEKNSEGLDVMARFGLENGCYYVEDGKYYREKSIEDVNYLQLAVVADRIPIGIKMNDGVYVKNEITIKAWDEWMTWRDTANVRNYSTFFSDDDSKVYTRVRNQINTKMSVEIPKFIKGEYNLDSDFDTFAKTINKMNADKVTDLFAELFKKYGIS